MADMNSRNLLHRMFSQVRLGKTSLGVTLFVVTAASVWLASAQEPVIAVPAVHHPRIPVAPMTTGQRPQVEVVFVLDTTSSMSGLIDSAKEKIWSVASGMAQAQPAPDIKMGLVAYRDRGDAYVTQVYDLSSDLDTMYAQLMDFRAEGGGDGPESVNQALYEAVNQISWSENQSTYKTIFLVGDAPPHMDYSNDVPYPVSLQQAKHENIVVNTIQCGTVSGTAQTWQSIAQLGSGEFFQVEQSGGAIAVTTPFDAKIASLAKDLDDTRLYYGADKERERAERKTSAAAKLHSTASTATLARRAEYNMSASGRANLLGENELVDAVSSGAIALEDVAEAELPAPLRDAEPEERARQVKQLADKRAGLTEELTELQQQRKAYLEADAAARPAAPAAWDEKVLDAVEVQSARIIGLKYSDTDTVATGTDSDKVSSDAAVTEEGE